MEAKTWTAVSEIFADVLDIPCEECDRRLAALPESIRDEVLSLLAAHEKATGFIEPGRSQSAPFEPGARLGPYRLIEKVGEGGMGAVYRAERDDGEFRRVVAVKVAAGRLFGPEAERRFLYERQILARLAHPNIVRLLDGGIHDARRYLVMEFVAGDTITQHAQGRPPAERLALFQSVCEAIQYAHQNLVIHRDIKPRNILVTPAGEVKILDFGIAQVIAAEGNPSPAALTGLHPMTLEYASPEQIRAQPLTIATDVYSLGVLLYELLTGRNPQAANDQSIEEAVRRITVEDPARPGLSKDLDAIVMKCLAKDPAARYSSVGEIRGDVDRFLHDLPVLAAAPSSWYTLGKFIRRNKATAAISAALLVSLAGGIAAFAWQARIAERRFTEARRLIRTVIFDIQPRLEGIPATLPLRKTLIESTSQYLEALSRDVSGDATLQAELAGAYRELARLQGDGSVSNLGNVTSASASLQRAEQFIEAALKSQPDNPGILGEAVRVFRQLCGAALQQGDLKLAETYSRRQILAADRWFGLAPTSLAAREAKAAALFFAALVAKASDSESTVARFSETAQLYRVLSRQKPEKREYTRSIALTDKYIAEFLHAKSRFAEAKPYSLEAVEIDESNRAADPSNRQSQMDLSISLKTAGTTFFGLRDYGAALEFAQRALAMREQLAAADPGNLFHRERFAAALASAAEVEWSRGKRASALNHSRHAVSIYELMRTEGQLLRSHYPVAGYAYVTLAWIEKQRGQQASGCKALRRAEPLYIDLQRQPHLIDASRVGYQRLQEGLQTCP